MLVFDKKIREHAVTYMDRVPSLHFRKPSHEFRIIALYDEGAGLVVVLKAYTKCHQSFF